MRWRHAREWIALGYGGRDHKNSDHGPAALNKTIVLPSSSRALTYFFTLLTSFHARAIDSPSERPNGCAVWQIELFKVEIHETREEARGSSPWQRSWRAAWKIVLITRWWASKRIKEKVGTDEIHIQYERDVIFLDFFFFRKYWNCKMIIFLSSFFVFFLLLSLFFLLYI